LATVAMVTSDKYKDSPKVKNSWYTQDVQISIDLLHMIKRSEFLKFCITPEMLDFYGPTDPTSPSKIVA